MVIELMYRRLTGETYIKASYLCIWVECKGFNGKSKRPTEEEYVREIKLYENVVKTR